MCLTAEGKHTDIHIQACVWTTFCPVSSCVCTMSVKHDCASGHMLVSALRTALTSRTQRLREETPLPQCILSLNYACCFVVAENAFHSNDVRAGRKTAPHRQGGGGGGTCFTPPKCVFTSWKLRQHLGSLMELLQGSRKPRWPLSLLSAESFSTVMKRIMQTFQTIKDSLFANV